MGLWANPLARKIIIYAGVGLAILYALRIYGNRQYYKGETAGRQYMAAEIEKQKAAEWAAKEAEIARAAEQVSISRESLEAERKLLNQDRRRLSNSLAAGLAEIEAERAKNYEAISSVPNSGLDNALRAISRELAGAGP